MGRRRAQLLGRRRDALGNAIHRQKGADHARGKHQGLILGRAALGRGKAGHLPGVFQAALARAGVGHARANHDGPNPLAGRAAAVQGHGSGVDEILRVDAHARCRPVADHQREVELLRVALDPARDAG